MLALAGDDAGIAAALRAQTVDASLASTSHGQPVLHASLTSADRLTSMDVPLPQLTHAHAEEDLLNLVPSLTTRIIRSRESAHTASTSTRCTAASTPPFRRCGAKVSV